MILANFTVATISIMGIWLIFQWLYRSYRVDLLKDRLFAIRDDLFDLARSGRISFHDPAYCMLRRTLNGFLLGGSKLGFLAISLTGRRISEERLENFRDRWKKAMDELQSSERKELTHLRERMNFAILDHLVLSSFAIIMTVVPVLVWMLLHHLGKSAVKLLKRLTTVQWIDRLDSSAMSVGEV